SSTNLLDLRARTMDPSTGRMLQQDPISSPVGLPYQARYVYAADRPTALADPSGLWTYSFSFNLGNWGPDAALQVTKLIETNPNSVFPFHVEGGPMTAG